MSDDNYRKPSSPRATRVGLGLSGTDASYDNGRPNETLSGRAAPGRNIPRSRHDSDDHYMDPPSETLGVEREELVRRLNEETESRARAVTPSPSTSTGLFGSTLRAHTTGRPRAELDREAADYDYQPEHRDDQAEDRIEADDADRVGLFQGALDHTLQAPPLAAAQFATTRPPPPPAGLGSRAPEAWRDEVRRMVDRAPFKGPGLAAPSPPPGPAHPPSGASGASGHPGYGGPNAPGGPSVPGSTKPSLRLTLDADAVVETYRAPKSGVPKLLTWLVILGLIGGGFAYFAQSQGGIAGLVKRFSATQPTLTTQDPAPAAATPSALTVDPGAAPQQPPAAAAAPAAANQVPPAAAPTAPAAPAAPAAIEQPAQPSAAVPTTAQPAATAPAVVQPPPADSPKAAEPRAAKPAAAAPVAKPKPARPVRPQQPVVKVRPIESDRGAAEPPPPEHPDIPYVPMPGDPPAPDEPR